MPTSAVEKSCFLLPTQLVAYRQIKMHYLAKEHWSPRYDSTFFTVQIVGKDDLSSTPVIPTALEGKENHPAIYYSVEVFSESQKHICPRRYSQFKWLHLQLTVNPPAGAVEEEHLLAIPPGSCPWQSHDEAFLTVRQEALHDYLRDVLARPGYSKHPAIRLFLELDKFQSK